MLKNIQTHFMFALRCYYYIPNRNTLTKNVFIWKAVEVMLLSSSILLFFDYSLEDCMRDTARMWCDDSDMLRELLSYEDSVIQFNYHHFLNKTLCCTIDCERRKTNLWMSYYRMFYLRHCFMYKCVCVYKHILVYNLIITYECSFVKCFMHLFQIIFFCKK